MKLIQKGTSQKGWSKKLICTGKGNGKGGCQAKLLVEQPDVFTTYSRSYDGSMDTNYTFECSECGSWTDFDYSGPTANIRKAPRSHRNQ